MKMKKRLSKDSRFYLILINTFYGFAFIVLKRCNGKAVILQGSVFANTDTARQIVRLIGITDCRVKLFYTATNKILSSQELIVIKLTVFAVLLLSFATALLDYHMIFCLSTCFLNYFLCFFNSIRKPQYLDMDWSLLTQFLLHALQKVQTDFA